MVTRFGWLALMAALGACADSSSPNRTIDAVGTPFYLAFKIPMCAATLVIAAPLAGLAGLADPSPNVSQPDPRPDLDHGVRKNCGPPYTLTSGDDAGIQ